MYTPDHLSTLATSELQRIMRDAESLPLVSLINHGATSIDLPGDRIWRDCFWKGSFARDTLLGWEERLMTPVRASPPQFTGGRFWKRFDEVRDGEARGLIVNYGLAFLPGRPSVRQVEYPDDRRAYVKRGDTALVLTYLNQPYRIVYDLIKVVDENNCIGVMHLGSFPNGRVFATFVMSRHNYPFAKMTVPDHDRIFESETRAPTREDMIGTWTGSVVFFKHPELALHNQFNPPLIRLTVRSAAGSVIARLRVALRARTVAFGLEPKQAVLSSARAYRDEVRLASRDTLLGRRISTKHPESQPRLRYVLRRAGA